ncbi:MAG: LCP family protein [Anaerolineae bacterium]
MRCRQVRRLLSFRREWTPEEAARAGEHLVGCPACQAVAFQYELMDRRLDRLAVPVSVAPMSPSVSVAGGTPQRASEPQPAASAPRQAGRGVLVVALAALVVVATIALGAIGPRPDLPGEPAASQTVLGPALPRTSVAPGPAHVPAGDDERFTVLLLGIDRRAGGRWGYRTDTIMIATADLEAGTAALLSVPRDLQVTIPGHGEDRINTANVYGSLAGDPGGGPVLVKETIAANFGIAVDAYVLIDFEGFVQVVDALDGIDVDVPRALHDPAYPDPRPEDPHAYTTIHFDAGPQHMDGERALQYVRSRMSTDDGDRMERQQLILLALGEAARDRIASSNLVGLVTSLAGVVRTDLTLEQLTDLAAFAAALEPAGVERRVLGEPLVSAQRLENGAMVTVPHWDLIDPVLQDLFGSVTVLRPVTHTVAVGETLWSIAQRYGLQPETIVWANPEIERRPDLLEVGQALLIPPIDGVLYTVQAGDSLEALAERYETTVSQVVSFAPNQLRDPGELAAGSQIMLPGGRKEIDYGRPYSLTLTVELPAGAPVGTGRFSWPAQGILNQGFWEGHKAIDIANVTGTPVRAADAGYVVLAGRDTGGYGNQLVIDHGNGYLTRYAHLNSLLVQAGDSVQKAQQIGTLGATGRATGPHLHFEIWKDGVPENPLGYLPGADLE